MPLTAVAKARTTIRRSRLPLAGRGLVVTTKISAGTTIWAPTRYFRPRHVEQVIAWVEGDEDDSTGDSTTRDLAVSRQLLYRMIYPHSVFPEQNLHWKTTALLVIWFGWSSDGKHICVDVDDSRYMNCLADGNHTVTFDTDDGRGVTVRDLCAGEELTYAPKMVHPSIPLYVHSPVECLRWFEQQQSGFLTRVVKSHKKKEVAYV